MRSEPKLLFVTVDVEEWYMSAKLVSVSDTEPYRKRSDVAETTGFVLDSLNRHQMKGTFFFIREVAENHPELVHRVIKEGHEVALHGETHAHLSQVTDADFAGMLDRSRKFFREKFSVDLRGYRAPYWSITDSKLAALKKGGLSYDASVFPCLPIPGWYGNLRAPLVPYRIGDRLHETSSGRFLEFPASVHPDLRIPGLGGYYFRNLGLDWSLHLLRRCIDQLGYCMFYVHPWELSDRLPTDVGMPFYMTRRAGQWARDSFDRFLDAAQQIPDLSNSTIATACAGLVSP